MGYTKIFIHLIWSTKNRVPYLDSVDLRSKVWMHIKENADKKNIVIDAINGHSDHCHCLISLSRDQSISDIMRLLKDESAYWINKNNLCQRKFEWQEHYYALSVSHSALDTVRKYIRNQEQHHKQSSFQEEYNVLMKTVFKEYAAEHHFESLSVDFA